MECGLSCLNKNLFNLRGLLILIEANRKYNFQRDLLKSNSHPTAPKLVFYGQRFPNHFSQRKFSYIHFAFFFFAETDN